MNQELGGLFAYGKGRFDFQAQIFKSFFKELNGEFRSSDSKSSTLCTISQLEVEDYRAMTEFQAWRTVEQRRMSLKLRWLENYKTRVLEEHHPGCSRMISGDRMPNTF